MRNLSGKTLIFYTFQSAAKPAQYNITTFKKSAPQEPKIRDVLYQLPLDYEKNSYHFRFKSEFFESDQKIIGWIDISNLLAKVPIVNSNIFVKILQVPHDTNNKLFNKEKLTAIGLIDPKGSSSNTKNTTTQHTNSSSGNAKNSNNLINQPVKAGENINKNNGANDKSQVKKNNNNIFDLESPVKSAQQKPQRKEQSVSKQNKQEKPYVPGSQTPQERLRGFQETCQRQQQQRQLQRKAISYHETKLTEWGYSGHKTINNLTTLLATLHTIWPQWQPVSLADMLKPQDVTALYKKAAIRLHPDKNMDKDYNTKYLSKRIFQLLNQAKKANK